MAAVILGLIAFQYAFGLLVKFSTGSTLWPPVLASASIAVGLWLILPMALLAYIAVKCDREAPIKSALAILRAGSRRLATTLVLLVAFGVSFSAINWTKSMIPAFTADQFLADLDHWIFGVDPWRLADMQALRGIMAFSYVYWFVAIYGFMILTSLSRNYRAALSIFIISAADTVAQFAVPSAGPIFWSRLGQGDRFIDLESGPSAYTRFADYLWYHYEANTVTAGTGISAMPSMHVALSFWAVLSFPKFRVFTIPFFLIVFLASVASGWHYVSDGIGGCVIAYGAHLLANACVKRCNVAKWSNTNGLNRGATNGD